MAGFSVATLAWQPMHRATEGRVISASGPLFSWQKLQGSPRPTCCLWLKGMGCVTSTEDFSSGLLSCCARKTVTAATQQQRTASTRMLPNISLLCPISSDDLGQPLGHQDLLYRTVRFVDRLIGESGRSRI